MEQLAIIVVSCDTGMSGETGDSHGSAHNACPPGEPEPGTGQQDSASHARLIGRLASSGRLFSGQLAPDEAASAIACLCGRRLPRTLQLLLDGADVTAIESAALLKACTSFPWIISPHAGCCNTECQAW